VLVAEQVHGHAVAEVVQDLGEGGALFLEAPLEGAGADPDAGGGPFQCRVAVGEVRPDRPAHLLREGAPPGQGFQELLGQPVQVGDQRLVGGHDGSVQVDPGEGDVGVRTVEFQRRPEDPPVLRRVIRPRVGEADLHGHHIGAGELTGQRDRHGQSRVHRLADPIHERNTGEGEPPTGAVLLELDLKSFLDDPAVADQALQRLPGGPAVQQDVAHEADLADVDGFSQVEAEGGIGVLLRGGLPEARDLGERHPAVRVAQLLVGQARAGQELLAIQSQVRRPLQDEEGDTGQTGELEVGHAGGPPAGF
jgi:hypothetical protein